MNQSPHPKNSGRRRGARNGTPQKTYASENDAASYRHAYSDSPYTPQKLAENGTVVLPHVQSSTQKKSRNRNTSAKKTRDKQDRHSPTQQQSAPLAFAGASFHASPAPNSLPLPSFLARTTSAPDSPSLKPPVAGPTQELSPPTTDSEENSSPSPPLQTVPRNEESPLEFFFKADRAEKARGRRASSANAAGVLAGPFSPPHDSPQEPRTFPRLGGAQQPRRPTVQRNPSSGIPSSELDGTPGRRVGHAFSTPYSERIKAARSKNPSAQVTPSAQSNDTSDRSEALKRFLGVGVVPHQSQPFQGQPQSPPQQAAPPKLPRGMFPASIMTGHPNHHNGGQQQSTSGADGPSPTHLRGGQSSHHPQGDAHADQARKLEDSLRRVLKLGPS
ncbi:hypothetical protein AB5N19_04827 [Seiridium cardinale]|uniref:Proteophosphoglycan 5 n=1 Tax=Seiridium cardinale TaxID=138064 RepID=A0ABR2XFR7_9PEZI